MLISAAPATATGAAEISVRFTTKTAGAPSGLGVHLLLRDATDPSAKPPALHSATVKAPDGVSFDTAVLPQCRASDTDLQLFGSNACPADTRLAIGTLVGITGFGPPVDPLTGEDHVFNGPNQLIEVITAPGTPLSPAFDRLRISGSTLTAHPPSVPGGPPDGKSSIRSIDFQIPLRTAGGRSLITTPPVCPVDHEWTTHATFYFDDNSVASAVSQVPCSPRPEGSQPRVSLIAFPHVVKEGQPVQVRFRVSSQASRCVAAASIRFAGRTVHADRRGMAAVAITFRRAGERRALATSPGCHPATAATLVVPRGRRPDSPD